MYVPLLDGRRYTHVYDRNTAHIDVVYSYDYNKIDRLLYTQRCLKVINKIKRPMRFGAPNIIHSHYMFNSGYVAYNLKKEIGTPYISTIRNSDVNGYFRLCQFIPQLRQIGLRIMLNAEFLIFPSPAYHKKVIEQYVSQQNRDIISSKALVIPNVIADFWHKNQPVLQQKQKSSAIRALFVGEWTKNKNIETIVEVIDHLRHRGHKASLMIVGDGPNRNTIRKLAASRAHYISTHDWVKDPYELLKIYRNSDVFLMPSFTETFGLVYIEAMSQGLPVVYTRGQGIDGYYEDGVIGYGCHPRRVGSIALSVERIMDDYENISMNCIEASSRFNWADIAREYNRIYKSILPDQDIR
jgi:glycosyltransferase involved in cell wall biosynthesis